MAKPSTRKMPCSMRKDGAASIRSEHLVPCLTKDKSVFVGVKTGKQYPAGCMSYLGRHVSTDDILAKLGLSSGDARRARPILNEYLPQLQEFKIGNVLSLSWVGTFKKLELKKDADRPPSGNKASKLPP
jgi:hypothetical protein